MDARMDVSTREMIKNQKNFGVLPEEIFNLNVSLLRPLQQHQNQQHQQNQQLSLNLQVFNKHKIQNFHVFLQLI